MVAGVNLTSGCRMRVRIFNPKPITKKQNKNIYYHLLMHNDAIFEFIIESGFPYLKALNLDELRLANTRKPNQIYLGGKTSILEN